MIGFPMENRNDIQDTIDMAKKLKAHETQVNIVTPWPGTEMMDYALGHNNLDRELELEEELKQLKKRLTIEKD